MAKAGRVPKLVIFDCDGVLVDSEPLSIRVLAETMHQLGLTISMDECYRQFLGRSIGSFTETVLKDYGRALTTEQLAHMRERLYELYRRELKPIAGVSGVLDSLGVPFCVASSSQPDRIRLSLDLTGLSHYFGNRIYSSTMVEHGKPAPDLFFLAAKQMGARPEDCVVVEDSPAGIEAANRAAMLAFAFVGGSHAGPASLRESIRPMNPSCIFDRMEDLPRLISGLAP
jgi:HAD superfamily hydrolase (TIGR01509 family)